MRAIIFLSILVFSFTTAMAETLMYRYKDSDGNYFTSNTLPPEFANQGYEMVTFRGNIVKTVPPRKSDLEIRQEQMKRQAKVAEEKARVQQEKAQRIPVVPC